MAQDQFITLESSLGALKDKQTPERMKRKMM
jgi:hypothetical protein